MRDRKYNALRKTVDGKLFCKGCNGGKGQWLDPELFAIKAETSTGRSYKCKQCVKNLRQIKYAIERENIKEAKKAAQPKIIWLPAIPYKQSPLSNLMACNLWDSSLDFGVLNA